MLWNLEDFAIKQQMMNSSIIQKYDEIFYFFFLFGNMILEFGANLLYNFITVMMGILSLQHSFNLHSSSAIQ